MARKAKAGRKLEQSVVDAYRQLGAWGVEHDVELAGNQIDVYVELATPERLLHRIAIEVKDRNSPVGINEVNEFGHLVKLLRSEQMVDEGLMVAASGFTLPGRNAAHSYGIKLLDSADLDTMLAETESAISAPSIPTPPKPYFAHPYSLQENFAGRVRERLILTEWLISDQRPFLSLVAIGGMGKSALTWAWLQRDVLGLPLPGQAQDPPEIAGWCRLPKANRPEGVFWWSFYETDANFATFLDKALTYASNGMEDLIDMPSTHDKVRALVDLLHQRRLLIVLDGFERELRAYASLSASYQGDSVTPDTRGDYRACTDPHLANFLRMSAALPLRSRVLITSRLFPRELDGMTGCHREDLDALELEDAVTFFHAQGVQGTRAQIATACKPYGYHPLTLRLLTGMILRDPINPGDVTVTDHYSPLPELTSKGHRILALSYDALGPPLRELLSRLSAFRSPVGYEVASILSPFKGRRELGLAFTELADRGLIYFDPDRWRYDLHPIVRAYGYDRLTFKEGIHSRLRDYFAAALSPDMGQVNSVDDLTPLIELYHHTVRAGQYDKAVELFRHRLADTLYYRLGAYRTEIDLLRALFPNTRGASRTERVDGSNGVGEVALPQLAQASAQAWTLSALANSYSCSGRLRHALPLLEAHNTLQEGLNDPISLAIGLQNLGSVQLELGELEAAEANLRRAVDRAVDSGSLSPQASSHQALGRLLIYQGIFEEAKQELDAALEIQAGPEHTQSKGLIWIYRGLHAMFTGEPKLMVESANMALHEAGKTTDSSPLGYPARDPVWAYWLLGVAHVELGQLLVAKAHLHEALARCREIDLVELEPDILLAWARWHLARGGREEGRNSAEEALTIADRAEYRLKQAEIHNFLAQWELYAGDVSSARERAEMAKGCAWCNGPPHCYKPALDEAEELLELIGN